MIKKFFLLALVVALGTIRAANAQTSLDYYKGLFDSWDLPTDILSQENTKLDALATKKDLQTLLQKLEGNLENNEVKQKLTEEGVVDTNKEGRYLLLLASQSQTTPRSGAEILGYQNIIVVCDSLETTYLPQGVSCASNNLNFVDQNPNESSVSDKILQTVRPTNINSVNYYILPQVLLITPQYQKSLGNYFKALSRAQRPINAPGNEKAADAVVRSLLKNLQNSSIFESAIYALVILLFIVALKRPITLLVRNPQRFLEQSLYAHQAQRILNFLSKNSGMISLTFLILALFYIPIFYALNIKAQQLADPTYPIEYLSTTLNPLNIPNYITAQNLFRTGLLFYIYISTLFAFLFVTPNLVGVFTKSAQKMTEAKFKMNFIKWLIPVTIALNGLLLAFVDLESLAGFLSLSVIILLTSLLYLKSRRIEYPNLFSNKERQLVTLAMLAVLSLNILYPLFQKGRPIKYAYEPLIGIKDEVIALPYSKQWEKNVLFEPYYYNGDSKVYADGYLIYSPSMERVVNKPLDKFSDMGSSTIVSGKPSKIFTTLLRTPKLLNYLSTAEFSPLFVMDNTSSNVFNSPALEVQITFNCSFAPPPAVIKLETMTLNKFVGSNDNITDPVSTESADLINFPGCKKEIGLETFEVPLDPHLIPQDFAILEISGIDAEYLTDLKIFAEGKEPLIKFINKEVLNESQYKILYMPSNPSREITNYSTAVIKESLVDMKTNDQGFDLSVPINELMKAGALQNPFIIWTDKPNEVIQKL